MTLLKSLNFTNKVVLIIGASSGMGAATAKEFAKLGASLAIVDRRSKGLAETATKCKSMSPCKEETLQIIADTTCESDVERIFNETMANKSRLDVLVNCVGILESGTIFNANLKQLKRTLEVNVFGAYGLTTLAVPELIKTKGNIVNISSVCGLRSFPNVLAYNISKSAIDQFTRSVALEVGAMGVRCNAVNPGVIKTPLHIRGGMSEENYKKFIERAKETHALGRYGEPHEVAQAIVFLASDLASFITGVTLSVDGGRHAMCPR